jgi:septum site-determining protein MinC
MIFPLFIFYSLEENNGINRIIKETYGYASQVAVEEWRDHTMSVEAAFRKIEESIFINLTPMSTFKEIKEELEEKISPKGLFKIGSQINLDIGNRKLSNKQILEIEDILLAHGLHLNEIISNEELSFQQVEGKESVSSQWDEVSNAYDTVMVNRHLRSGQKLFSDGNIVILGDINPGAEEIAGGSILVMGSLRGMAHAGAFGDEKSVIAAFRLNPTQLRIANHITRPPDGETITVNNPELARIRADKVIIEKLKI